jgi:hypothetical protein
MGLPRRSSRESIRAKAGHVDRPTVAERLCQVRKNHTSIDAQITEHDAGVEIRYFYSGEPVLSRCWPTRRVALTDAAARLKDLQRAGGWNTHW